MGNTKLASETLTGWGSLKGNKRLPNDILIIKNFLPKLRDWPRGVPVGGGPGAVFRRRVQADPRVPVDTGWT